MESKKVKTVIMAHIYIPSTLDVEAGRSHTGGQPGLQGKLKINLSNMVRLCLHKLKIKKHTQWSNA